jgi:hypothetical protein
MEDPSMGLNCPPKTFEKVDSWAKMAAGNPNRVNINNMKMNFVFIWMNFDCFIMQFIRISQQVSK